MGPIDFENAVQECLKDAEDPDSHTELDPSVFHPSQIVRCKRRAYCSKLGLDDHTEILGIFRTGTLIHEFLEEHLSTIHPRLELETDANYQQDGIEFTGRADVYDPVTNCVYDFKTRGSWYNFDPPSDGHVEQAQIYMAALNAEYGKIVYISKGKMEVRVWPPENAFDYSQNTVDVLVEKAKTIRDVIEDEGLPSSSDDIPFAPCTCYFCSKETLKPDSEFPGGE